MQLVQYNQLYF